MSMPDTARLDWDTLPPVIGLSGYGGAGKSAAARHLVEAFGYVAPHIGRPMKNMLRSLLADCGYDAATIERYVDGDLKREIVPELRITATEAQQTLGTEWGRNCCHGNLWLDLWLKSAAGRRAVSESVRFENEALAIRKAGGVIIEIRRPGVGPLSDHPSERIPFAPDIAIHNDGPIEILHTRLAGALARFARG